MFLQHIKEKGQILMVVFCYSVLTQPAFACSKLTVEALEQSVTYVQS